MEGKRTGGRTPLQIAEEDKQVHAAKAIQEPHGMKAKKEAEAEDRPQEAPAHHGHETTAYSPAGPGSGASACHEPRASACYPAHFRHRRIPCALHARNWLPRAHVVLCGCALCVPKVKSGFEVHLSSQDTGGGGRAHTGPPPPRRSRSARPAPRRV
jgi:hypothetical protein